MNLLDRKYLYFLEIAKAGNLQKAGEVLGLTQPALTGALKRLEEELGTKLFERQRYGLKLTADGRRFYDWLLEHHLSLQLSFRHNYLQQEKVLRIGAGFLILSKYLNFELLKPWKAEWKIQILSQPFLDLIRAVELDLVDFAFIGWDDPWVSDLELHKIMDCPCAIVGRKGVYDHIRNFNRRTQLGKEPWVVEIHPSTGRWMTELQNRPGILVYQHNLFIKYILEGKGVAEIEIAYFNPSDYQKLVVSLVPSQFTSAYYGLIHKKTLSPELKSIARQMANSIAKAHATIWPNLRNGTPEKIRGYIESKI